MSWSLSLMRIRGIEIKVHATFVLILIWAAWYWGASVDAGLRGALFGVVATILLFLCVTLHELGHSLQAMKYGIHVEDITLLPIGGVARLEVPSNPRQELWIALAGPAVNVAIAGILIVVGAILNATSVVTPSELIDRMREAEWSGLLPYLTLANIYLVAFNALPAFPMDGGRVLRALLALRMDYRRATEIAVLLGQGMALLFGFLGFATGNFFLIVIAVFVWIAGGQEGAQVAARSILGRATVSDAMIRQPQVLHPDDPLARAIELVLTTAQSDFPVVDHAGRVVGLLTFDDILRGMQDGPAVSVSAVMHRDFPTARPDEPIVEVQSRMASANSRALPIVLFDGRLAGLLTAADIGEVFRLLAMRAQLEQQRPAPKRQLVEEGPF